MLLLFFFFLSNTSPILICSAEEYSSVLEFDELILVMDERIFTKSDTEFDTKITASLPIQNTILQNIRVENTVEGLIHLEVIKRFAGDIPLYVPKEQELQERFTQFREQWSNEEYEAFLDKKNINNQQIRNAIYLHVLAEKYLEKNLGISATENSNEAIDKYNTWMLKSKEMFSIRYIY